MSLRCASVSERSTCYIQHVVRQSVFQVQYFSTGLSLPSSSSICVHRASLPALLVLLQAAASYGERGKSGRGAAGRGSPTSFRAPPKARAPPAAARSREEGQASSHQLDQKGPRGESLWKHKWAHKSTTVQHLRMCFWRWETGIRRAEHLACGNIYQYGIYLCVETGRLRALRVCCCMV